MVFRALLLRLLVVSLYIRELFGVCCKHRRQTFYKEVKRELTEVFLVVGQQKYAVPSRTTLRLCGFSPLGE